MVERAVLLGRGPQIDVGDLALSHSTVPAESKTLEDVERATIREVLARTGGNVLQAARELGLSRSALYRRIERYGL